VETVGVTSGASAPEKLVARVCDWFRARGVADVSEFRSADEDVVFKLPVELRRELALAESQPEFVRGQTP
jgi:4-hydroxy-3-methylbut-2-en-1-yl diphosphate reductase